MKSLLMVLVVLSFLNALVLGVKPATAQLFVMENPLLGQKAPDFTLNNTKGESMSMTKYRDGKPAILFFWATWCPHCREQIVQLNKNRDEVAKKGIKIMVIDVGEPQAQVAKYLTKKNIQIDSFVDEDSEVSSTYGLIGVPSFFFIDKDGVVKAMEYFLPKNYEDYFKTKK